jgi:hypothetical protein
MIRNWEIIRLKLNYMYIYTFLDRNEHRTTENVGCHGFNQTKLEIPLMIHTNELFVLHGVCSF